MAECLRCGAVFAAIDDWHTCPDGYNPRYVCAPMPQPGERLVVPNVSQGGNQVHVSGYLQESEPAPSGAENTHAVWTSFLAGNLCGSFLIFRADLPRDRPAMRHLLHERLQAFGDALLEEYDKQIWEDE